MPEVRFEIASYDYRAAERLSAELGVSLELAQILVRRGHAQPAAARRFLAADARHPLDAFGGLRHAAATILAHADRGERVTVHGDYDADGVCSTAVLVRVLRTLGADVDWYLPDRRTDGYGLNAATIERLAARGTRLLITADCGITAVEEVAAATAAGMAVVVTDHHAPRADGVLPDAPIVHPRLGGYPCADLCAAGVAHRLAAALLAAAGLDPALADEDLDLVALATVADVVPLHDENRRLVRAGLRALSLTRKPGLQALMAVARVDPGGVDATDIGFRLAPRINAAGRVRRADAALELLLTDDPERAAAVAAELDACNAERKHLEERILFEAEAQVRAAAAGAAAHVLAGERWHPGVIGIVASRIAERHHRPAVLIALDGETGTGSGRSIPAFDLLGGFDAASGHLLRHGGHRAAAGLTIERDRVDAFRAAFAAHAAAVLRPEDLVAVERIDAVVAGNRLGMPLAEELERLAPFGCGNPGVSLLVPAAHVADAQPMGEGRHVAFTLSAGGARTRAVRFGGGSALPADPDTPLEAAVRLEVNRWNGTVEPRVVLRHARRRAAANGIDVLGERGWRDGVLAELDRVLDPGTAALRDSDGAGHDRGPAAPRLALLVPPAPGRESTSPRFEPAGTPCVSSLRLGAPPAGETPRASLRSQRDRRGGGIAGLLADLVHAGEPVLAVAAHAPHRARVLGERVGGFGLVSYAALEDDPVLAAGFAHIVAVDPPTTPILGSLPGAGWTHLAWGEPELRFSQRILEWDYALREPLAAVYRSLRRSGGALAEACEELLCGDCTPRRSPALAGRLVRVLAELALVEVERDGPALRLVEAPARTVLERSAAFRAYAGRLEAGRRWLSATAPAARAAA